MEAQSMLVEGAETPKRSLRTLRLGALLVSSVLVLGVVGWSVTAELAGAVVSPGQVEVEHRARKVQSPIGGPVGALYVRDGDRVSAGQILIRLDETQLRTTLNIVSGQLAAFEAQRHRLMAERDGTKLIVWPKPYAASHPEAGRIAREEQQLLELRLAQHASQKRRLAERIGQLRRELEAVKAQKAAKQREAALIRQEQGIVSELSRKQLTTFTRPISIERDIARFDGDIGSLEAQIPRVEGQITEVEIQQLLLDQSLFLDAQKELRSVELRIDELTERRVAAEDQLKRTVIRAPTAGMAHELAVNGEGSVLRPGDYALTIVPQDGNLVAQMRIRPQDIDQVYPGQRTRLRFTAFNQRTTPELTGEIVQVSADLVRTKPDKEGHFTATVHLDANEFANYPQLKLVPGMPVEAHILTGQRTLMSYLLKPFTDQMSRALRED